MSEPDRTYEIHIYYMSKLVLSCGMMEINKVISQPLLTILAIKLLCFNSQGSGVIAQGS